MNVKEPILCNDRQYCSDWIHTGRPHAGFRTFPSKWGEQCSATTIIFSYAGYLPWIIRRQMEIYDTFRDNMVYKMLVLFMILFPSSPLPPPPMFNIICSYKWMRKIFYQLRKSLWFSSSYAQSIYVELNLKPSQSFIQYLLYAGH